MKSNYHAIRIFFTDVLNKTILIFMIQSFLNDMCVFKVEVEWLRPHEIFDSQEW